MAAVPQNNLREQLRLHSARGALSKPPPPRLRPPGFTFKKTSPAGAQPRGLCAAAALRDKDVNTSLPAAGSAPPASGDRKTHIQDFFPAAASPRGRGLWPGCASAAPARPREVARGPGASGTGSATEGPPGAPARQAGPVGAVGDEWDDIDDFDLSGIEKKYCRAAVLSPKGQRAPRKASHRSPPRRDRPPASPGTRGDGSGPHGHGASGRGETSPEAEQRPLSQQSLICLEDLAPCSRNKAEGLWEDLSADIVLDDDGEEAHPAANDNSGESQRPSSGERNSPLELDKVDIELFASTELEEDDYLDIIPPSPEEELPPFSPSVKSVSKIFKESPTGGGSTASSVKSVPGKVAPAQPVAESDPSAEDAAEFRGSQPREQQFEVQWGALAKSGWFAVVPGLEGKVTDKGLHLEQQLYGVMDDICKLVDAIPLHELKSLSCAKDLLQQRDLRRKLLANSVTLNKNSINNTFPRSWKACLGRGPLACPGTTPCSGLNWSFSSGRNSLKSTPLPSTLAGTVNSSNFSTKPSQTFDALDTSYASKQGIEEITCPETTAPSSSKVNGKDGASLGLCSGMSFNSSGCEKPGVSNGGNRRLLEGPLASTALKGQSRAPASIPAESGSGINDTDFDLDHFDIDDFDEGWENSAHVSAPETLSVPLYQPIREGPPAKSLSSKIMSRAKGAAVVSNPAAPKPSFLMATKDRSDPLVNNPALERFRGMKFSHSEEMVNIFHRKFGLHYFRTNQLEAINAALLGEDCFILMPTGGGKSLCYQLPACVSAGVTIVISPLRSLIIDQVQKLKTLDIAATYLTGDRTEADASKIYMQLSKKDPVIKLLYVTPEKVCASSRLMSALENLYDRKLLARFVIDEAHCVSQWGHDFRQDYKRLNMLRKKFRSVPMMALTATANPRVQKDIQNQLEMLKPQVFTMSFNRHNLKYDVLPKKPKKVAMDCLEWIKKYHPHDSGIIYCLSRHECDTTAAILQKEGLAALAYHAGLTDSNRDLVQKKWINQEGCQVICATIAFGMGIDKPDVRYVIHASLPKSIEGYYQESGRAGRDGEMSHCLLFYSYSDVTRLRRLILMEKDGNSHTRQTHFNNLYSMVHYCENVVDCRRIQLLAYFGETNFNPTFCKDHPEVICDNCSRNKDYKSRNVTDEVKSIIRFVQEHCGQMGRINGKRNAGSGRYTLNMMVDIFLGTKSAKIQSGIFGKGAAYSRHNVERLFRKLVLDKILDEDLYITANDQAVAYVILGEKAQAVLDGLLQVEFHETENASAIRKQRASVGKMSQREEMVKKCLGELTDTCKMLGKVFDVHYFNIFSTSTLKKIAETLSSDVEVLLQIDGVTEDKLEKYGAEIIKVMDQYSEWTTPEDAACQSVDTATGSTGTPESDEEAEDVVTTSSYFCNNADQRRKRKRPPNFRESKRKKTSSGGGQQFHPKGGYSKYRRTKRPWNAKAPASSACGSAPCRGSAAQGAAAKLGIMAPPKPRNRHFLQPSYSLV
ncbi:recQ-like DNA helicase BLM isoform X1 [Grus americana]|uniref:recQ-like DNA helicase BLM isoform X1 n=1 Tax=Grus americana TaxID=9117 RepID=UPI002407F2A5|nr:recQ-like DNA helicase BLM isoform X1 [Grus americana]